MNKILLFLSCFGFLTSARSEGPAPAATFKYYKQWGMVSAFPRPKFPLEESTISSIKSGDIEKRNYVSATFDTDGKLMTVKELFHDTRKVEFTYFYDGKTVSKIEMILSNGAKKIYYTSQIDPSKLKKPSQ